MSSAPANLWEWSTGRIHAFTTALLTAGPKPIARLKIPSLDLDVMVLEGADESVLSRAVGHITGTAAPGGAGNIAIAGHRDGFFRVLKRIERGDIVTLMTPSASADYIVDDLRVVDPTAVEVLDPTSDARLTLITCYPFYFVGSAPLRFVVRASSRPRLAPGTDIALRRAALGPLSEF